MFKMTSHANESLFLSDDFSDVTFVVENESIKAHKLLLAASCPYFKTMLFGATNESKMSVIELKNVSYKIFLEVLRAIYLRKVVISDWTSEELKTIIEIAHEYQCPALGCVIAESIELDTQIEDILEDVLGVAKALNCVPLLDKVADFARMRSETMLVNEEAFDKLSVELMSYLIEAQVFHPADTRLVFAIANFLKTTSIKDKKVLLSKIDWKSLPGKYSEPLVRMFLEDDVDGLRVKDWTSGLRSSKNLLEQIAAVYLSYNCRLFNDKSQISSFLCAVESQEVNAVTDNRTEQSSVVIFFREQVTNVSKIKFTYKGKADISVTLYGIMGETAISGTTMDRNREFNVPSNVNFWSVLIRIHNKEFNDKNFHWSIFHFMINLQFCSDEKAE